MTPTILFCQEALDDFKFVERSRAIHVLNAPSPAATASIVIGQAIADKALAAWAD